MSFLKLFTDSADLAEVGAVQRDGALTAKTLPFDLRRVQGTDKRPWSDDLSGLEVE